MALYAFESLSWCFDVILLGQVEYTFCLHRCLFLFPWQLICGYTCSSLASCLLVYKYPCVFLYIDAFLVRPLDYDLRLPGWIYVFFFGLSWFVCLWNKYCLQIDPCLSSSMLTVTKRPSRTKNMDLAAVRRLLLLTQDDRSLKDHTSYFLDLAYQTHYPDSALISFFMLDSMNS